MGGIVAHLTLNPIIINRVQITSANNTKIKDKVGPSPIGSAKLILEVNATSNFSIP